MAPENFSPKRINQPVEEILPEHTPAIELETAEHECAKPVGKLTADISGIGPKAAARYLLRFEYGFDTPTLTDYYDITKSTLSKQTNQVHRKVLRHPTLARIIGQYRSKRARLTRPNLTDQTLWEDTIDLHSQQIYAAVDYHSGDLTTSYSWNVDLVADLPLGDKTRRLRCTYLVDDEYGVLLKRVLRGLSPEDAGETFRYEPLRTLEIYPLPHPQIHTTDGTLLDALEYHVSYDIKRRLTDTAWNSIEKRIQFEGARDSVNRPRPEHGLPEMVTGKQVSTDQLHNYTAEVHRRNNLEHLLRAYPLTRISNIPLETIDLLWNGSVTNHDTYLDTILRTSEPQYLPGSHRTIWALNQRS